MKPYRPNVGALTSRIGFRVVLKPETLNRIIKYTKEPSRGFGF